MTDDDRISVLVDKLTDVLRGESFRDIIGALGYMLTRVINDTHSPERYWLRVRDSIESALPKFADIKRQEHTKH